MHIELFQEQDAARGTTNTWYWRTVNKGATTAVHGQWDDRAHAARQAKAHVVSCIKPVLRTFGLETAKVLFTRPKFDAERNCWIIRWA